MELCKNTRNAIISMYNRRIERQRQLKEQNLIIAPIRADDMYVTNAWEDINDTFSWFMDGYRKMRDFRDGGNYSLSKGTTEIIGYFAAACPKDSDIVKFGWSITSLKDEFNKDYGLLKAFKLQYNLNDFVPEETFPFNLKKDYQFIYDGGTSKCRIWHEDPLSQFSRFKDRCRIYFKQAKID